MAGKAQNFTQRQHMLRPGYEIFRYCDSELGEVSLHHHDFYEIYLFLNGSVEYSIESRIYRLLPGDILLIGPMTIMLCRTLKITAPMSGWCSGWTSGIWNSSAPPRRA